jgi:hypothetical protein
MLLAGRRLPREVFTYSLIVALCASAVAQSLGDLARQERQKKAPAQVDATNRKVFSNLDSPQPGVSGANDQTNRNRSLSGESLLQITAPADGTVVSPGETIKVRVTSPKERTWQALGIIAAIRDIAPTEAVHSLPAEFSIAIPSNISACREYGLTAFGRTSAGEIEESAINVDIERPDTPVSISSFQFPSLTLEINPENNNGAASNPMIDRPFYLIILATFADGSNVDVTESSYVTYESSKTTVVTVEGHGGIKAVALGTASIIVSYKNPKGGSVQVSVPVTVLRKT